MSKRGYVYLLTNFDKTVLYAGVTSDLVKRVYEHKNKLVDGFTKKYSVDQLVYYEVFDDIEYAIAREKQIKGGSRKKKEDIINSMNPDWRDLYKDILN
ncbi:MAG: GIY-YIG nuclease family protein [Deferribacterales bacterium]